MLAGILCLLLVSLFAACGDENRRTNSTPDVPIEFESTRLRIDKFDDSQPYQFLIKGKATGQFTIDSIRTSCGCLRADEHLAGIQIDRDDSFEIRCELNVSGHVGSFERFVRISLVDADQQEKKVDYWIDYEVDCQPFFDATPIKLKRFLGEDAYEGDFTVSSRRTVGSPKISISQFENPPFEVTLVASNTAIAAGAAKSADDRNDLTVKISVDHREQEEPKLIRIAFTDGHEASAGIEFTDIHPVSCELKNVFLGFVEAETDCKYELQLRNNSNSPIKIQRLACNATVQVIESVKLIPAASSVSIPVTIQSGAETGRHSTKIEISYANSDITDQAVDFSWIVK